MSGLLQVNLPPSNLPFLFAAFAVTWVVFFAYAFFVSRRRQEMQREVRDLQQTLKPAEGPHQPS
ncbi:MAG TPA: CcmD family protein [Dehalococcoidia bacterium]|nr:CcmD family protein [Dehalococcoidia bacterium]